MKNVPETNNNLTKPKKLTNNLITTNKTTLNNKRGKIINKNTRHILKILPASSIALNANVVVKNTYLAKIKMIEQ